jgi:MFS family permease
MMRMKGGGIMGSLRPWVIWGVAALFYLYEFFVRVAPSVMEPELQRTFHLSAATLGGALSMYFYIYAPMQLLVGGFLDRLGARAVLGPACLLVAGGCFLEIAGDSTVFLVLGRLLQGFGSSFAFVGTMYLATRWFPANRLALLSGLTTALGMLGAVVANAGIVGLVQRAGWQASLFDAGIGGVILAILLLVFIPRRSPQPKVVTAEGKAVEVVEAAGENAPAPHGILHALKVVMSNPQTWLVGIVGTALYMPLQVLGALWGVEYIVTVTGATKDQASWSVSMLYFGWMFAGPAAGWLSDFLGRRRMLLLASSLLTLLSSALLLFFQEIAWWQMNALMLGIGVVSSLQVVSFVCAVEHNPRAFSGTAIASTNMVIMLLGGAMQPVVGLILDWASGHPGDGTSFTPEAYRWAMSVIPLCAAIGLVAAFFVRESFDPKTGRGVGH